MHAIHTRRALVVEDNHDIGNLLRLHLEDLGLQVDLTASGRAGLEMSGTAHYDLVVLDLMLPELDGLEICRLLRNRRRYVPIMMVTAKSTEVDRVLGLEIGADDYLVKPFGVREFQARAKALLRRVEALSVAPDNLAILDLGGLRIDPTRHGVWLNATEVALTAREFDLLYYFARHPGQVFSRDQLLDQVWGCHHAPYRHTVNSHINRLRGKIESDPSQPEYILTVWGVGYRFTDLEPARATAHRPGGPGGSEPVERSAE